MYNVNFNTLATWILPVLMRQTNFVKWLNGLVYPIARIHEFSFLPNRDANLYKLAHNGQVFRLRKLLNEKFDRTEKTIEIEDGLTRDRIYAFVTNESKPLKLITRTEPDAIEIHNSDDYADSGTDFIVWVPNNLSNHEEIKMKAELDFYKLPAKRYRIYRK